MKSKKYIFLLITVLIFSIFNFRLIVVFADDSITSDTATSTKATSAPLAPPSGSNGNVGGTSSSTPEVPVIVPDPVLIHLDIEGPDSTLFNNQITVSACSPDSSASSTVNAYCAIQQSGLDNTWDAFGDDKFLDSVGGVQNNFASNHYWIWFSNFELGQTSLNKHLLSANENILLTITKMPLKASVSTLTPHFSVSDSSSSPQAEIISVFEFGFDSSFNAVWLPAISSSLLINNDTFLTDDNGSYDLVPSTVSPVLIVAKKDGFLDSPLITLNPIADPDQEPVVDDTANPPTKDSNVQNSGGGGGGGGSSINYNNIDVTKALNFIAENQNSDGSFSSSLYTDWAAIALASGPESQAKEKIKNYLKNLNDSLSSATDYERRAMALMALDINPYIGTATNYIQKILEKFDGTQIGDSTLVNDDIFAIFPLVKAGYSTNDSIVQKIITFIISKQKTDGSWEESIDLSASAVQALSITASLPGVNESLNKAKNYLKSNQKNDGGFGSSFSTSWVLQAILALGDSPFNWVTGTLMPNSYLYYLQQADGGLEPITSDRGARIWATSYAIPAGLNKTWNLILVSFPKPADSNLSQIPRSSFSGGGSLENLSEATSSIDDNLSILTTSTTTQETIIGSSTSTGSMLQSASAPDVKVKPKLAVLPAKKQIVKKPTINEEPNVQSSNNQDLPQNVALVGASKAETIIKSIVSFFIGIFKKIFQ